MFKRLFLLAVIVSILVMNGCASVPMASLEQDKARKEFKNPPEDKSGIYIYRNSFVGQALKKSVSIDEVVIGETANKTYFYTEVSPGSHKLSTESEFSDNSVTLDTNGGENYFAQQYIKMGLFVGGAGLKLVSKEEGQKQVEKCRLAK